MGYLVLQRFQSDRKIHEAGSLVDFKDDAAALLVADGLIEKVKPAAKEKQPGKQSEESGKE